MKENLQSNKKDVASDNDFQKFLLRSLGLLERFSFLLYCVILFFLPVNNEIHKAFSTGEWIDCEWFWFYFTVFVILFIGLSTAFLGRELQLFKICERKSKKRFDFLPLSDKACQELNINSIEDYCEFLNRFLFRTPTGKTYKSNMSFDDAVQKYYYYWKIAKMPKELLLAINEKFEESHKCIIYETSVRPYPFYMVYERSGRSSLERDISRLMNC